MRFLLPALTLLVAAVSSAQTGFNDAGVPWGTVSSGTRSNIRQFETHIFQNQGQLENYWVNRSGQAGPVPRGTNFQTDMVVAVHLGDRPTGGYTVFVDKVQRVQSSNIQVNYVEQKPDSNQIVTTVVTQPWVLVRVKRVGGNITFSRSERVGPPTIGIITPGPGGLPGGNVPFQPLVSGVTSGARGFRIEVLESNADLSDYIATYHRQPRIAVGPQNWNQDALIAIHLGQRSTGGYSVMVIGVEPSATGLRIYWAEVRPAPGSMNAQMITSPYILVRVPRANAYDFVSMVRYGQQ